MASSPTNPWSLKEILIPATGRRVTHYYFKQRRCKRIQLDGHLAQQLAGYTLIEKDLRSTLVWLGAIEARHTPPTGPDGHFQYHLSGDRETYDLVKGLFVASLTFYGKCFTRCEGRRIKLTRRNLAERFRECHDFFMGYRHNFAAHSGADSFEEVQVALVLPPRRKAGLVEPRIMRELKQPDLLASGGEDISFASLAKHAQEFALRKISELSEKILREEVLPRGYDFWYAK